MSVLGGVQVERTISGTGTDALVARGVVERFREEFADDAWAWYHAHREDPLVEIPLLGIVVARVRHACAVVQKIVGPDPSGRGCTG